MDDDTSRLIHSTHDLCERLHAAADEVRHQSTLSRRAIDRSRQLRQEVQVQGLRVMELPKKPAVTCEDADQDPKRTEAAEPPTTAGEG